MQGDEDSVLLGLVCIISTLRAMQATLSRMGEKCDPYIYYHRQANKQVLQWLLAVVRCNELIRLLPVPPFRVRLPMSGWRSNPALPKVIKSSHSSLLSSSYPLRSIFLRTQGLIYEGVSDEPVQLYGETGAQSSIVPSLDAALGIRHEENW